MKLKNVALIKPGGGGPAVPAEQPPDAQDEPSSFDQNQGMVQNQMVPAPVMQQQAMVMQQPLPEIPPYKPKEQVASAMVMGGMQMQEPFSPSPANNQDMVQVTEELPQIMQEDSVPAIPAQSSTSRANLAIPTNKVFDRTFMLRVWRAAPEAVHASTEALRASTARAGGDSRKAANSRDQGRLGAKDAKSTAASSSRFGDSKRRDDGPRSKNQPVLKPSDKAYKVQNPQERTREQQIERDVRSLLNKITPDNLLTIVDQLALIMLERASELEFVISIIFQKALCEPHYCETYADMIYSLRSRYPEFPPENEGDKPITFTRVLLNTCQNEFETIPTTLEPTEEERASHNEDELVILEKKKKDKVLANMKFIGHLFLRQLLAVKVIGQVVHDLIGIKEQLPEEHMIECVCELLQTIGFTLEGTQHGKLLMSQFAARLMDLMKPGKDNKSAFSKRIRFCIQDMLDLRQQGWQKKLFKEQAKTLDEVRKTAVKEERSKRGDQVCFTTAVVGARPGYIDDLKNPKNAKKDADGGGEKINFDKAYVLQNFRYFSDDRDTKAFLQSWTAAKPTDADALNGLSWLIDEGYDPRNARSGAQLVSDAIQALVMERTISWECLRKGLAPWFEEEGGSCKLEEHCIDVPGADVFFHILLAQLLVQGGNNFNPTILKDLPGNKKYTWSLLLGAMKRVKNLAGPEGARKALNFLSDIMCHVRSTSAADLKKTLIKESAL